MPSNTRQTIVVGGGLAGLTTAHTLIEHGRKVLLLEKKPSLGGNAVKASSGINGAETDVQAKLNISDTVQDFAGDTAASAGSLARPHLIAALTANSASAIHWLTHTHGIDLGHVARLGGHGAARTHRDGKGAPGWAIMSVLIKQLESQANDEEKRVRIVKNASVSKLSLDAEGRVVGVEVDVGGGVVKELGDVILATGGYAADFTPTSLLATYRPDLLHLPTTNGDHATGDGHILATSAAAALCDMDQVQVHPTGFVDPAHPDAKTKFLAAEALRGVGGLLVGRDGARFVDEGQRRDVVTRAMGEVVGGEVLLVLGEESAKEVAGHCAFYQSKGLMQKYPDLSSLASGTGIPLDNLKRTFATHGRCARGEEKDVFGKTFFHNADYDKDQAFLVARMTPVVHYTMGGITTDASSRVLSAEGKPIPGLFAAGEVMGGVHGANRLGGSSLLEAVVFGRVAGGLTGL